MAENRFKGIVWDPASFVVNTAIQLAKPKDLVSDPLRAWADQAIDDAEVLYGRLKARGYVRESFDKQSEEA